MDGILLDALKDKAYLELQKFRKISPLLVMRRYKLSEDVATKICQGIWLRQHMDARKLAKGIE